VESIFAALKRLTTTEGHFLQASLAPLEKITSAFLVLRNHICLPIKSVDDIVNVLQPLAMTLSKKILSEEQKRYL